MTQAQESPFGATSVPLHEVNVALPGKRPMPVNSAVLVEAALRCSRETMKRAKNFKGFLCDLRALCGSIF
ncbi:MAG: hypothetical protein AB1846_09095 [Chloroflexota bacterium]